MTAEITINGDVTIEVTIDGSVGVYPNSVESVDIVAGVATEVDTEQSDKRPSMISIYNSAGKRIDKNLGEPTVTLDTTYKISYTAQAISYSNATLYWL